MAEKVSTIVIKVDLNCPKCYNKIRKVLCKFDCKIRSKTLDKKANVVIVTGVFDPECFSKCLMCKAGNVIKGIDIVQPVDKVPEPKPPKPKPKPPPPEPKPAPKQPEPAPPKPEPVGVMVCEQAPLQPKPYYPVPGYPPCWEGYERPPPQQPPCYDGYGRPPPQQPPYYDGYGMPPPQQPPCYDGYDGYGMPPPQQPPYYDGYGMPPPCHCGCGGARNCVPVGEYSDENQTNLCIIM